MRCNAATLFYLIFKLGSAFKNIYVFVANVHIFISIIDNKWNTINLITYW